MVLVKPWFTPAIPAIQQLSFFVVSYFILNIKTAWCANIASIVRRWSRVGRVISEDSKGLCQPHPLLLASSHKGLEWALGLLNKL